MKEKKMLAKYARELMKTQNWNRRLVLYGLILLVNDKLINRVRIDHTLDKEKNENLVPVVETSQEKKSLPSLTQVLQPSLF